MKEECLICGAPLTYLDTDEVMACAICHKQERSKTRCVQGHFVCSECHTQGMDSIFGLCMGDSYLAILAAIDFAAEHLNVQMDKTMPVCSRSKQNNQCIGKSCPFVGGKK